LWVDERFLFVPTDPEWRHIAPVQGKLLIHGLTGATALLIGPFQFSDRLRTARPKLHRWLGRIYVGAVAVSAPLAAWIGFHFERPITAPEQIAQGSFWFLCTLMALLCALRRQFLVHKVWMMRSYSWRLRHKKHHTVISLSKTLERVIPLMLGRGRDRYFNRYPQTVPF